MCGIFGINGNLEAAPITYLGLYALQHRGEESAGIVTYDGRQPYSYKGMGLLGDVFDEQIISSLKGKTAIGHVRYSTTGASVDKNAQPFLVNYKDHFMAIAHNGNLTNTKFLRDKLEKKGSLFQTTMDSELIIHLLARAQATELPQKIKEALSALEGAYALLLMHKDTLIGARDPYGWRPLVIGKLRGNYFLASETCAFDLIGAQYIREVEPGEIVLIKDGNIKSYKFFASQKFGAACIFEHIYFARPDSKVFGRSVYQTRKALGRALARQARVEADIVIPVPDSGNYAAIGYAEESQIPLEMGIVRNHYIGRTFIQPSQFIRDFKVKVKLNPIKDILRGKRIVVIEDSIVRGTTTKMRIRSLRKAGAREIHMRVSCPPLKYPCYYGIDFPTQKELIAFNKSVPDICRCLGLDSLQYLSYQQMLTAVGGRGDQFCTACFNGNYRSLSKQG